MKAIAITGSPRKDGNTEILAKHTLKAIEEQGGITKSSVSKTVDYVVVGEGSGSKSKKADELNITKLNLNQLKQLLGD